MYPSLLFILFLWSNTLAAVPALTRFETDEVVLNKLYPREKKIELSLPQIGTLLNQAYLRSLTTKVQTTYYFNEEWGFSLDFVKAFNFDKEERFCLEHLYNDYSNTLSATCPASSDSNLSQNLFDAQNNPRKGGNFGPLFPKVRELNYAAHGFLTWNPIYGKQLFYMSKVFYFDLVAQIGGGLAFGDYYPESTSLRNGKLSRPEGGVVDQSALNQALQKSNNGCPKDLPGVCPGSDTNWEELIGKAGRPDPVQESVPTLSLAIGQKVHFLTRYHARLDFQSMTLFAGQNGGITNLFHMSFGVGARF